MGFAHSRPQSSRYGEMFTASRPMALSFLHDAIISPAQHIVDYVAKSFREPPEKWPELFTEPPTYTWTRYLAINIHRLVLSRPLLREPTVIDVKRRRRLSLTASMPSTSDDAETGLLAADHEDHGTRYSQQEVSFLFKLPVEVRQVIYTYVLGEREIFLRARIYDERTGNQTVAYRQRLYSERHLQPRKMTMEPCHMGRQLGTVDHRAFFDGDRRSLLDLLCTSRRIYTEAISILYTSNGFCMPSSKTILALPRLLLPQRFHSIRSLSLHFDFFDFSPGLNGGMRYDVVYGSWTADYRDWHKIWDIIHSMEGLQDLRVWITLWGYLKDDFRLWREGGLNKERLFGPMRKLRDRNLRRWQCYVELPDHLIMDAMAGCDVQGMVDDNRYRKHSAEYRAACASHTNLTVFA